MATLAEIRQQYPQYNDLSDTQLADSFHSKFYSDIPKDQFYSQLGVKTQTAQQKQPSSALGGLASLADVTVGGILPAAVQTLGYPLARLGRSPEEAQAATQRMVSAVEKPFGKALGVTETPEYQQESSRQLMDFIGQNFQKGAKWIADKTGLSPADVESYMGTASIAAPALAKPVTKVVTAATAPLKEQITTGLKLPFEERTQARREAASLKDYERGPQIDAAAEAQRLKIFLSPEDIQQTAGPKMLSAIAGEKGLDAIAQANKNQVRKVGLNELGLPETTQLTSKEPFSAARAKVSEPYTQVAKLPTIVADDQVRSALDNLRPDESLIGSAKYSKAINAVIDDAGKKLEGGLTGADLLKNIQTLRQRSRKVYNNKSADLASLDWADTNLAIANVLESTIEANIFNPKLLGEFRDARQKMAKSYAYEGATDFNTGMIDVNKLSRITAKDNTLTGDIASLGKIAGNFPDVFTKRATPETIAARLKRSGPAGIVGGVSGYALGGGLGGALGSVLGAGLGEVGQSLAARKLVSPEYQAGLNLKDMRIPVNQAAAAMQPPIPNSQAIVPYQPEVLGPSGQGGAAPLRIVGYDENQRPIYAPSRGAQTGPNFTMPPQPTFGAAHSPYAQRGLPNEVPRQVYEAQKRAELAQEFKARDERKPASGAIEMQLNPLTGLPEISKGLMGATPETFSNFGSSLETAANKVTAGRKFDLTAAEKVAWDKTKVDLAEIAPGFKSLSDKAIAEKMMDRSWVEEAIVKAKQKAQMQADIAARATTERQRQVALKERDKLMGIAEDMEESLRQARPDVSGKVQGPKTRTAFREGLFSGGK